MTQEERVMMMSLLKYPYLQPWHITCNCTPAHTAGLHIPAIHQRVELCVGTGCIGTEDGGHSVVLPPPFLIQDQWQGCFDYWQCASHSALQLILVMGSHKLQLLLEGGAYRVGWILLV